MGRAMMIAFFILSFNLSMSLLNEINECYYWGSARSGCPDDTGVGHYFINFNAQPLLTSTIRDAEGNILDANDPTSYNRTMQNTISYKPNPTGIVDIMGFFSWVITGGRFIINALFMPLFGFPDLLTKQFWIPTLITYPIGLMLMIIEIVGLYEFFSGREII